MKVEALVRMVSWLGPRNLSQVARRINVSTDTAHRLYRRVKAEGLAARPSISMEKLGLRRFVAFARPGQNGESELLKVLFGGMADYAYLEQCQRLVPYNLYMLIFSVPPEHFPKLGAFLGELRRTYDLVRTFGPVPLSWYRQHPVRAPWYRPPLTPVIMGPLADLPKAREEFTANLDYKDLLLLAALQVYPDASFSKLFRTIAQWADGGYSQIRPHLAASLSDWYYHLQRATELIRAYPMHVESRKPVFRMGEVHHWTTFTVWWNNLLPRAMKTAAMASTAIGYLRADGGNQEFGIYFSTVTAPTGHIPQYLAFLSEHAPAGMRVAFPKMFGSYLLPIRAYLPEEGRWGWNEERLRTILPLSLLLQLQLAKET